MATDYKEIYNQITSKSDDMATTENAMNDQILTDAQNSYTAAKSSADNAYNAYAKKLGIGLGSESAKSIAGTANANETGYVRASVNQVAQQHDLNDILIKNSQLSRVVTAKSELLSSELSSLIDQLAESVSASDGSGYYVNDEDTTDESGTSNDPSTSTDGAEGGIYSKSELGKRSRAFSVSIANATGGQTITPQGFTVSSDSLQYKLIKSDIDSFLNKLSKNSSKKSQAELSQDYLYFYDKITSANKAWMPQDLIDYLESGAQKYIQ